MLRFFTRFLLISFLVLSALASKAQASDHYKIIITTPGYTSIYRYNFDDFEQGIKRDFRLNASAGQVKEVGETREVSLTISGQSYHFVLSELFPVARLQYDRNRRLFKGAGLNYVASDKAKYQLPTFKGVGLNKLRADWTTQIEKVITDKSMLSADKPNIFVLEAEIDTDGVVHKIVELNGALRQYSKQVIDKIYDIAYRGWTPAQRNGQPCNALIQMVFEVKGEH